MSDDKIEEKGDWPEIPPIKRIQFPSKPSTQFIKRIVSKKVWKNCQFDDLNGNATEFVDCDFSYSVFNRAYFHNAKFKNCRFIGCLFFDCNFRGVNFYLCDLKYARFHRSLVEAKSIVATIPHEPNIRREALQNLRANAAEIGDFPSLRLLVLEEIAANKDHYKRAMIGVEEYYQKKYPATFQKFGAGWSLAWLHISSFIWGHGEKPSKIILSGIVLLLGLTLTNLASLLPTHDWTAVFGALGYTISLFFDLNENKEFRGFVIVDYAIVAMRYLYVGLYISVLYKIISHR